KEYTGMSADGAMGSGWRNACHPEDVAGTAAAWARAVKTGEEDFGECRFRRADGVYRWFLARGVAVRDGKGEIIQWIGTCTDVDDQRRALAVEAARLEAE